MPPGLEAVVPDHDVDVAAAVRRRAQRLATGPHRDRQEADLRREERAPATLGLRRDVQRPDGPLGRLVAVLAVVVLGVRVRHDDPAEDVQAAYRAVAGQADDAWAPAAPAQVDDAAAVDRVLGGADGSGQSHEDHAIGMGWPTAATAAGRGGAWPQ